MAEYKPNSHKFKTEQTNSSAERKPVEKVVSGSVKVKKNEMRKLADIFISEDVKNVKSYVLMDVLVPTIKKAIVDIVTDGINMVFFGGTGSRRSNTNASYVSYRSYSDRNRDDRRYSDNRTRNGYSYNDITLDNRGEADEVLRRMDELIDEYQVVSVADLYDLVGVSSEYTDNKYGWTNLQNASVERVRDGYRLKLPKALPIER